MLMKSTIVARRNPTIISFSLNITIQMLMVKLADNMTWKL